jgi:hypothetical protein
LEWIFCIRGTARAAVAGMMIMVMCGGQKLNVKNSNNPSGYEEYPQYNSDFDPNNLFSFTQAGFTDQSHYKPLPGITRGKDNLKKFPGQ